MDLAPAFAPIGYNTADDNRRITDEVRVTARRSARLAAQNDEQMIDEAHDFLMLLSRSPVLCWTVRLVEI